jgi:hypothetical protein
METSNAFVIIAIVWPGVRLRHKDDRILFSFVELGTIVVRLHRKQWDGERLFSKKKGLSLRSISPLPRFRPTLLWIVWLRTVDEAHRARADERHMHRIDCF